MKEITWVAAIVASVVVTMGLVLMAATHERSYRISFSPECAPESAERRAEFIVKCSEAANPKSDEEGEDLVRQCESTASHLFCPTAPEACRDYSCKPCSKVKDPAAVQGISVMSRVQKKVLHSRIRLSDGTVKNATGDYRGLFDYWSLSEVPEWSTSSPKPVKPRPRGLTPTGMPGRVQP